MKQGYLYKILRGPVVSEKAYAMADISNQIVFKVATNSNKKQIKLEQ